MAASEHLIKNISETDSPDSFSSLADSSEEEEEECMCVCYGRDYESDTSDSDSDEALGQDVWCDSASSLRKFSFTKVNSLLVNIPGDNKPVDWFLLLFDDMFLELICRETNNCALELCCNPNTSEKSHIRRWTCLTVPELKTFLALLISMGSIKMETIQSFWDNSYPMLVNLSVFMENMSCERFLTIMYCLRFSNPICKDRQYKIKPIVDYFNNKMSEIYYPSKEFALDQPMVLVRGRLYLGKYRHFCGPQLYSLTEPNGLVVKFCVLNGEDDEILGGKDHALKVVMHLLQGKLGHGHSVYMGSFYNSVSLASKLISHRTYCTGLLRSKRKYNPPAVKNANLNKGETIAKYREGVMVGKWRDRYGKCLYISTEFENNMCTVVNNRKKKSIEPLPITQYDKHAETFDRIEQLLEYYPLIHESISFHKKIFVHILQLVLINSLNLFNMHNFDKKMDLYDFRLDVVKGLLSSKEQSLLNMPPHKAEHYLVKNEG